MSPEECISALDRALADAGQDIVLRRTVGLAANTLPVDVTVRARVEFVQPGSVLGGEHRTGQTVGGLRQMLAKVIMSQTQILEAQWYGGDLVPADGVDPQIPDAGDALKIDGRWFNVQMSNPKKMGGVVVRIELQARGTAGPV